MKPLASRMTGGRRAVGLLAAVLATALGGRRAWARLGEDASSVAADQLRWHAKLQVVQKTGHAVHDLQVPAGANIRQFVSGAGKVFAVSWSGGWRPDLRDLMGAQHYDRYVVAARQQRRGRGPLRVELPGLVVVMGGHQRAFFGHAYLTELVPPGFQTADLR